MRKTGEEKKEEVRLYASCLRVLLRQQSRGFKGEKRIEEKCRKIGKEAAAGKDGDGFLKRTSGMAVIIIGG
ncbi:hypothetical protein ACLOJK_023236, partial [Asimina triloba]